MSRRRGRTFRLRLWLALALVVIVGVPTLTNWALSSSLSARPAPGSIATLTTIRTILGNDASRWRDPNWQRQARQRFAALQVDVFVEDTTGHQVFATSGTSALLHWWLARISYSMAVPPGRVNPSSTPPPRLLTTIPLFTTHHSGNLHAGTLILAAVALALLQVPSAREAIPPPWLEPAVTLAALLLTLAVVAWGLQRLVLRPLASMSQAAGQIAGGNLAVRLPSSRALEVAEVAAALAGMSASLAAALQRQAALEEERRLFIGTIAHDLHTPLFVLRGYLQGLENGVVTTPEKVAAYIAECRTKVDALARLIADLFAYTKVEYLDWAPQCEPVELGALMRQTMVGLQPLTAEKHLIVTLEGPDAPVVIMGDRHLLTRAVENLAHNALRYTPAGGKIHLSWGLEGPQFVLRVADTGPGIPAQDMPYLFTPLYRGESSRNRETGGAGLGLAIALRILQAHGGDLTADNRAAGGAIFTATLPAGSPAHAAADARTESMAR